MTETQQLAALTGLSPQIIRQFLKQGVIDRRDSLPAANRKIISYLNGPDLVRKKILSQTELASLLSLNQSSISKAFTKGILTHGADWLAQTREYLHHLVEVAAGRRGDGDLDLAQETARLRRLAGDRIAIDVKKARGELVHIESISHALSEMLSNLRTQILGLPTRLTSRIPALQATDIAEITEEVQKFLIELSNTRLAPEVMRSIADIENAAWGSIGEGSDNDKTRGILDQNRSGRTDRGLRSDTTTGPRQTTEDRRAPTRRGERRGPGRRDRARSRNTPGSRKYKATASPQTPTGDAGSGPGRESGPHDEGPSS